MELGPGKNPVVFLEELSSEAHRVHAPPIVLPSLHLSLSLSLSLLLTFFLFLSFPSPFYEVSGYTCLIAFVFVCKNSLPPILHVYPNFPLSLSLSGVFFLLGHSLLLPLLAAPEAKAYRDRTP